MAVRPATAASTARTTPRGQVALARQIPLCTCACGRLGVGSSTRVTLGWWVMNHASASSSRALSETLSSHAWACSCR